MPRGSLVLAIALMPVAACDDATQPAALGHVPLILASVQDIPEAGPAFTACEDTGYDNVDGEPPSGGGHFDTLSVVLKDTAGNPTTVCGNLVFNNQVHTMDAVLATDDADWLYPWVHWWRGSRGRSSGAYALAPLWDSNPDPHTLVSIAGMEMPLGLDYDGVGAVLIKSADSLAMRDSAFLCTASLDCGSAYAPLNHIQYRMQYWRNVDAPVLDSARVTGPIVTLWWHNHHEDRAVDSTVVYRNGDERVRLGHAAETFADSGLADGSYRYSLKHFSAPVVGTGGLANPNSAPSNDTTVLVAGPTAQIDGPDWITETGTYQWTVAVSAGTAPFTYAWWHRKLGAGWQWVQVGTSQTYSRAVGYSDLGFILRVEVRDAYQRLGADTLIVSTEWGYR